MKPIKYLSYLSLPILYFVASNVFAIGVFTPPPSDKSLEYLGQIFGSNIGTIYLGGVANPVLAAMFEKFNIIIVSIAVVIVSYIGIVSTINTAQEGQAMGKKWSSIWLPMRSMIGMLLMVPTPGTGYSMIQVTVLWAILQGVGAADQVWNLVLNYLSQGLSVTQGVITPSTDALAANGKNLSKQLLESAVCMASINSIATGQAQKKDGDIIKATDFIYEYKGVTAYNSAITTTPADLTTITDSSTPITYTSYFNIGVNNPTETGATGEAYATICGSYLVTATINPNELNALSLKGSTLINETSTRAAAALEQKILTLNTMFSNFLYPIAQSITISKTNITPGFIAAATEAYVKMMSLLLKPILGDSAILSAIAQGKDAGWIVAGSFYAILAHAAAQPFLMTATVSPSPTKYNNSSTSTVPSSSPGKTNYLTMTSLAGIQDYLTSNDAKRFIGMNLTNADNYFKNDVNMNLDSLNFAGIGGSALPSGTPGWVGEILSILQSFTYGTMHLVISVLQGNPNEDPLLAHAVLGSNLMAAAEATWAIVVGIAAIAIVALAFIPFMAAGVIVTGISIFIMPIIIVTAGAIWIFGAMLAVYLPMIPYMIFAVTVIGWFLLVIEAIIAAPIIALGLIIPSGDELGKIESGLMLLINIMLRPVLMIFGFVLAARLYHAVMNFVNFGIVAAFDSLPNSSILAPLALIGLYVGFTATLANKCFALIYVIPDKILRWVGAAHEQTDASSIQEAKQSFETGSKGISGAGNATATAANNAAGSVGSLKSGGVGSGGGGGGGSSGAGAKMG